MTLKIQCITVDCSNPALLANFWANALGWQIGIGGDETGIWIERELEDPQKTEFPDILFYKTPDKKTVKNRLHLDLRPDDQEAEIARLEALGAKRVEIGQSEDSETTWAVMTDPEGNEFCILKSRPV